MAPVGYPYRVLVVEDQETRIDQRKAVAFFEADRDRGRPSDPYLELAAVTRNFDDTIQYLELSEDLPDAIVLDDRLPEGGTTQSRSIEIMIWLHERCDREGIAPAKRPRAVLWTANEPQLAYTFCVVGGMQFRDKRDTLGDLLPVGAIWDGLAGRRWQPDPFPTGLTIAGRRAALPWLEAGWPLKRILAVPELVSEGVSEDRIREAKQEIRKMPRTAQPPSLEYPENWAMAVRAAKSNGWVWVPLDRHGQLPSNLLAPLVIDPEQHRKPISPYGPLPAQAL